MPAASCGHPAHPHHTNIIRRVDLRLVPILSTLYLLLFLCRQNIGNAKTYGLEKDLGLSTQNYQLALTFFFFTYSVFDIPSNILLKMLKPNVWLPLVTVTSGVVTVCMGFVQNSGGLYATRLVLGMTECGLFPGVAYVITLWYRKSEAQFRQALFFCAASMAGAFAGVLAVGISKMDGIGGIEGWRWILIIEGILTTVVGFAAFWIVLDIPSRTTFLSLEEKEMLLHRIEADEFGEEEFLLTVEEREHIHAKVPKSVVFRQVFTDWHLPLHILVFWAISCPLYSISLCLPTIVMEMGYTKSQANFLTVPIYVTACLISLCVAYFSDRMKMRTPFLAGSFCMMALGFIISAATPKAAYAGIFIAACGVYPAFPGMITWCTNNLASSKKRSIAMAVHIGFGSFGGAMGANFYRAQDAPRYILGHCVNLGFVVLGGIAAIILYISYVHENNKREGWCQKQRAELEQKITEAKEGEEEGLRHRFLVKMENSLASEGDRSKWFRFAL